MTINGSNMDFGLIIQSLFFLVSLAYSLYIAISIMIHCEQRRTYIMEHDFKSFVREIYPFIRTSDWRNYLIEEYMKTDTNRQRLISELYFVCLLDGLCAILLFSGGGNETSVKQLFTPIGYIFLALVMTFSIALIHIRHRKAQEVSKLYHVEIQGNHPINMIPDRLNDMYSKIAKLEQAILSSGSDIKKISDNFDKLSGMVEEVINK